MQYLPHVQGFGRNPPYICSAPNSRPMNCGIVIMLFPKFTETQILAQDFVNVRLRQCFEEANLSGHLVRRKFAPTVCDHLSFGQCRAPSMCHEQPYRLAGFLVRSPHASAFRNTSAGCSDCLDFVWIDVEA